jgi:hypothetical protein
MNEFLEGKTPHFSCCFSQPELHSPLITTAASNTFHPPITSTAAVLYSLSLSLYFWENSPKPGSTTTNQGKTKTAIP